jgi:hypothetical protein
VRWVLRDRLIARKLTRETSLRTRLRVLVLPAAIFLVHAIAIGGWLVDDAGISLAYARNLAGGHGLVSQPGMSPVEGFSNPLWVFLLSAGFRFTRLSPLILPKILCVVLVLIAFGICLKALSERLPNGRFIALLGLCLVSIQTSIVVWCVSGLENALTLFLTSLLIATLLSSRLDSPLFAGLSGCLVTAFALTRPEGIIYGWLYPVAIVRSFRRYNFRALTIYVTVALLTNFPYLLIRLLYFGDLLPTSYYAKGGPGLDTFVALVLLKPVMLTRMIGVLADLVGPLSPWMPFAVIAVCSWSVSRGTWTSTHSVLGLVALTSLAGFLLLPPDWMPDYRYGTAFLFCGTLFFVSLLFGGISSRLTGAQQVWKVFIAAALMLGLMAANVPRTLEFRRYPAISVRQVAARAKRLEVVASLMHINSASWLTPDVGGALLYSHLRIFDLGMLCDRRIARYLGEGMPIENVQAFHNYVFEELEPTFISMRAYHSWIARMQEDARFQRDYVPLHEFVDLWIEKRYGKVVISGEYVRRSTLISSGLSLQTVQSEWAKYPSPWDG